MSVFDACVVSFGTVLTLLAFMAVIMAGMTRLFPAPAKAPVAAPAAVPAVDAAVESAIAQAVAAAYPDARVSRIREIPR